ncbi:MAG TPA: HK97 family phage prohead protease [Micromonosporaceae bacterium]
MNTYLRTWALDDIEVSRSYADGRTVEAYAAVFDTPVEIQDVHGHYIERIAPTAFDKTLRERGASRVGVYYHHGMTLYGTPSDLGSVPIGQPLEIRADGRGLRTVTRFNKSPLADSVLEAIRAGDIRGYSFRGRIFQSNPDRVPRRRPGEPLPEVTRTELGLFEYGPTPTPAYESAAILAVRSAEQVAQSIAGLDDDQRAELVRLLTSTTPAREPETVSATPSEGAGAEEPRTHSGRQSDIVRRINVAKITRGM